MRKFINWLPLIATVAVASLPAFGVTTDMPWEAGVGTMGRSMSGFIAPTIATVGGAIGFVDLARHHGGGVGALGASGVFLMLAGVAGSLWPEALAAVHVTAAII
jgi:hypothetical protein